MPPDDQAARLDGAEAGQPVAFADRVPGDTEAADGDADVAVGVPALELLKTGHPVEGPEDDAGANGNGALPPGAEHAVLPDDKATTKPVSYFTLYK